MIKLIFGELYGMDNLQDLFDVISDMMQHGMSDDEINLALERSLKYKSNKQ